MSKNGMLSEFGKANSSTRLTKVIDNVKSYIHTYCYTS